MQQSITMITDEKIMVGVESLFETTQRYKVCREMGRKVDERGVGREWGLQIAQTIKNIRALPKQSS